MSITTTRCWGKEIVQSASAAKDIASAQQALGKAEMRDGSLTAVFERSGKGKITYSHVSHTREETRAEIIKWVSESNLCSFGVVILSYVFEIYIL